MKFLYIFQNEMRDKGEIKVFRLGTDVDEEIVVFTEDYRSHVQCVMTEINIPKEITGKHVSRAVEKIT